MALLLSGVIITGPVRAEIDVDKIVNEVMKEARMVQKPHPGKIKAASTCIFILRALHTFRVPVL